MRKTINGKIYEFIEGDCENCAFQLHPGCAAQLDLDECVYENDKNIWKEVTDDRNNQN